jgi:threonine dehydrogenase-like Zn-dependent dehydrogenase
VERAREPGEETPLEGIKPVTKNYGENSAPDHIEFQGLEYHADDQVHPANYAMAGSAQQGWKITRNGSEHLTLGPGYRLLRTHRCGVCSTDLDRRFLPFPLPQIIGHELIALDSDGKRHVVEINASHAARGLDDECPFCRSGLTTHCPERRVLGIHDLPGGFGPWVLAPEHGTIPVPDTLPDDVAVLVEPFAAALHAAEQVTPMPGETVAVLGPRRLGLLVVAALAARRRRDGNTYRILALSRHPGLRDLALDFGADQAAPPPAIVSDFSPLADIVVDTTGSPLGLELSIRLARREVHLKSTHGQPAAGLAHTTELVVDEITLGAWPGREDDTATLLAEAPCQAGDVPRVAWLAGDEPPAGLGERAELHVGRDAATLLAKLETTPGRLPRADIAVVEDAAGVDAALRPRAGEEIALVRPRGRICLYGRSGDDGPLLGAIRNRGLELSASRCGDFRRALTLLECDSELASRLPGLVTHRMPARQLPEALDLARSPDCIKIVLDHPES